MSLRVLISGGGIAGPAIAFWLTRLGHSCTIVERFPSLRTSGQQIDLREDGVKVTERMGILDELRKYVVDEQGLEFVDSSGKQKALFPKIVDAETGQQGFTTEYEMMRGDLCKTLYDAVKEETNYRFGVSVKDFENTGDGVIVKFSDGSEDRYDLLIGADGQGSRVRRMMLGAGGDAHNQVGVHKLGVHVAYFGLAREPQDPNLATIYHAPGRRFLNTRWHNETHGQCYLATMSGASDLDQALTGDVDQQKKAFGQHFRDAGWQAERLVKAMEESDDFYAQPIIQIKSDTWSKGRVVLLGDSAYCPSPLTGMGTSLALIGAYVLAGEISKHKGDLDAALKAYDQTLRPLVTHVQKLPPGMPGLYYPKSKLGVKLLHTVLGLVTVLKLDKIVQFLMYDTSEKWKLPSYAAWDSELDEEIHSEEKIAATA
ncbi:FAD/NAD(P)-binding domain-containing protein [Aaosphaeria arxii CBS 175.79]|uniref:FAD/NAD(P)-binding domain-containing protein n=1 Tax=Aaosphaeria arxii CBS 175.79 TaxID=1450172 RepID=A0A6A5XR77_9PLEO|nr:FAD/NAD(P)-binding domain-containing protein [Aaosphaeria arxii CBS 175.79]KAF2015409.1 FAD/NAD(P)-binding domain-containing protein [Aaosphaeria arxii CBS 175.79]